MLNIVDVKFEEWGKSYSFDAQDLELSDREKVIVEKEEGVSIATVRKSLVNIEKEAPQRPLKKVLRRANEEDLMQLERNHEKEMTSRNYCQDKIAEMGLQMKLVKVDYLFDGSKATFYFTADERVDFRELVKDLASRFHTRIELRQIGVRDEARHKGGIGPCGRILCCSTWINNFDPVSVKMAKKQGLSLNPSNISGMCGRLMCCLAYEYQNYVDGTMAQVAAEKARAAREEAPKVEWQPEQQRPEKKREDKKREDRRPRGRRDQAKKEQAGSKTEPNKAKKETSAEDGDKKKSGRRRRRFRGKKKQGQKKTNE